MCGTEFLNDDRGFLSPWAELARVAGPSSDGRLVLMEPSEGFTENQRPVASGHCSPMCAPVQSALVQLS